MAKLHDLLGFGNEFAIEAMLKHGRLPVARSPDSSDEGQAAGIFLISRDASTPILCVHYRPAFYVTNVMKTVW